MVIKVTNAKTAKQHVIVSFDAYVNLFVCKKTPE